MNTYLVGRVIVPGVTTCCAAPAPHCDVNGENLEIDGDCVRDGDVLVCPNHHHNRIWQFVKGWWTAQGGSLEENPSWLTEPCPVCGSWKLSAWSYRG